MCKFDEIMTQERMLAFVESHLYGISGSIAIPNYDYCRDEAPLFVRDGDDWRSVGPFLSLPPFVRRAKNGEVEPI